VEPPLSSTYGKLTDITPSEGCQVQKCQCLLSPSMQIQTQAKLAILLEAKLVCALGSQGQEAGA
jgi:hypothetical protein